MILRLDDSNSNRLFFSFNRFSAFFIDGGTPGVYGRIDMGNPVFISGGTRNCLTGLYACAPFEPSGRVTALHRRHPSHQRLLAKVIQNVKKLNTSKIILSAFNIKMWHAAKHVFAACFAMCGV